VTEDIAASVVQVRSESPLTARLKRSADHAERRELAGQRAGDGVGTALADEPVAVHAEGGELGAKLPQARHAVVRPRQKERVVVEAEQAGADARRVVQARHLARQVRRIPESQEASTAASLGLLVVRRDRAERARAPTATAARHGNERDPKVPIVPTVAVGGRQAVEIVGQRPRHGEERPVRPAQRQTRDGIEPLPLGQRGRERNARRLPFVEHDTVES
jgi:hypothetical protein